jgi:hypothetical protein
MSGYARFLAAVAVWTATIALPSLSADTQGCTPQERANQTLSEKLGQTHGVICPPDIDPKMHAPPPAHGDKMPVIPPPGSPGGDPNVVPK